MKVEAKLQRIAIMVCGEVSHKCTGNGCFRAFNEKKDAFSGYDDVQMVAFTRCDHCDGHDQNFDKKIEKLQNARVDTIHLSTCIRGRCDRYQEMAEEFSKHFNVIGYTHGSKKGKKDNCLCYEKKSL